MHLAAPAMSRAAAPTAAPVRQPLTDDQLFKVAPSIFANEAHDSRSDRYTYIPTITVLRRLREEGYLPFAVTQSRTRDAGNRSTTICPIPIVTVQLTTSTPGGGNAL